MNFIAHRSMRRGRNGSPGCRLVAALGVIVCTTFPVCQQSRKLADVVIFVAVLFAAILMLSPTGSGVATAASSPERGQTATVATFSLEDIIMAAVEHNGAVQRAAVDTAQARERLAVARGVTELQAFVAPKARIGSLASLETAKTVLGNSIGEEKVSEAAEEEAWEAKIEAGVSKALPTGGEILLKTGWGAGGGFGGKILESGGEGSDVTLEVNIKQPLFRQRESLQPWMGLVGAQDGYRQSQLRQQAVVENTIVQVADLFFQVIQAQDNLEVARQALEAVAEQNRIVEDKVAKGMGGVLDLREAAIQMAEAQQAVARSRRRLDLARRDLAQATGLNLEENCRLLAPPPITWDMSLEEAISRAMEHSTELEVMRIQQAAAQRALAAACQEQGPRYNTDFSINQEGHWQIGLEISWPFLDGQIKEHQVKVAALELEKINDALVRKIDEVRLAVRRDYYDYLDTVERVELANLELARAEEFLEITRHRYGLRMATELEMMDAINDLREAKVEKAAAIYARTLAAMNLMARTGNLGNVLPNVQWSKPE